MDYLEHGTGDPATTGLRSERGSRGIGDPGNLYHILGIQASASRIEVREAYLRLKSTYGAGSAALYSLVSDEEASEQMALADAAYRVLNDEIARRAYDQKLGTQRSPSLGKAAAVATQNPSITATELLGSERLIYAREHAEELTGVSRGRSGLGVTSMPSANVGHGSAGHAPADSTIKTSRSTLPIIKLHAPRAGTDDMKTKMQVLIDAGDPGDGDLYRRLRELCDVSEDEMCDRTKISIGYLHAIEANRFERLPQAVYVKGFLRSYCRYISAPDAEKLVAAFSARLSDWQTNRKV